MATENIETRELGVRDEYLVWLLEMVGMRRGWWGLANLLHSIKFRWTIPNDDNRATDGMVLRDKFAYEQGLDNYPELSGPCSFLEMLVALARRCDDEIMGDPTKEPRYAFWFQEFLKNADLMQFSDERSCEIGWEPTDVDKIVDRILDRTYEPDGEGGLFPLKDPKENQRKVEIWYQMSFWLVENYAEEAEIGEE